MASISSAAASSTAARLLLQAAQLPLISPLDVNLLIERELTRTSEYTSSFTARADGVMSHGHETNNGVVDNTVASNDLADRDAAVSDREVDEDLGSDNYHQKPPMNSPTDDRLQRLQTDDSAACCVRQSSTGELQFHCRAELTADVKKFDVLTGSGPSMCSPAVKTGSEISADGHPELPPRRSSVELAGRGQDGVSVKEINNNCRRGYAVTLRRKKAGSSGVKVGCTAAVRKSKRCNRGRRYHELMSQGVLHRHSSREIFKSLTV